MKYLSPHYFSQYCNVIYLLTNCLNNYFFMVMARCISELSRILDCFKMGVMGKEIKCLTHHIKLWIRTFCKVGVTSDNIAPPYSFVTCSLLHLKRQSNQSM